MHVIELYFKVPFLISCFLFCGDGNR